jgi:tRNA (guanine37-N1)-methyltransferase
MAKEKLRIDILTLFPDYFTTPLDSSLLGKAQKNNLLKIVVHDIRKFGVGKHRQVDDRPYGGGPGMVLRPDVLKKSLDDALLGRNPTSVRKILLDPAGKQFNQDMAEHFSKEGSLLLICGHYEGVDERFKEYVDTEVSVGDFILSGGEPAALTLVDAVSRLVPGVLGSPDSVVSESFVQKSTNEASGLKLLDYPVYTKPEMFGKTKVPQVLVSGNHQEIKKWRYDQSLKKTRQRRPDLLESHPTT